MKSAAKKYCCLIILLANIVSFAQNLPPVAVDDTVTTYGGIKTVIKPLVNDYGQNSPKFVLIDTVFYPFKNGTLSYTSSEIQYTSNEVFLGIDTIIYVIKDMFKPTLKDTASIFITVIDRAYAPNQNLDINNVKALFHANGAFFWDLIQGFDYGYEVPKGDSAHTMFNAGIWIGGIDNNSKLHVATEIYRSSGPDFYQGPVMNSWEYSAKTDSLWNRLWKINKTDIDTFRMWFNNPTTFSGYVIPIAILEWPAHGDTSKGQSQFLAPFVDVNGDNKYNPSGSGDYPMIRGDQALFYIFNDDRGEHLETGGAKLGAEIQTMAYAYNCPSDSALWSAIFLNFKIINRSDTTYDSTYVGFLGDMDIGDFSDDYIESDVGRSSYFAYNGNAIDGYGEPSHYGAFPPAQSVTFLKGPRMESDGLDNPSGLCNESANGYGFGDGVVDNESWGMRRFIYYNNCPSGPTCDPLGSYTYYHYLRGFWKDGQKMVYGGNGHPSGCAAPFSCVPADFMLPGTSDLLGWGTNCSPQQELWTEQTAGNTSGDRRGIGSTGPVTFKPGDTLELDIALVWARNYTSSDPYSSVTLLKQHIDSINAYFRRNENPCGGKMFGVGVNVDEPILAKKQINPFTIFPNPVGDFLLINYYSKPTSLIYEIMDIAGREIKSGTLSSGANVVQTSSLDNGVYILKIIDGEYLYYTKFIKLNN